MCQSSPQYAKLPIVARLNFTKHYWIISIKYFMIKSAFVNPSLRFNMIRNWLLRP